LRKQRLGADAIMAAYKHRRNFRRRWEGSRPHFLE